MPLNSIALPVFPPNKIRITNINADIFFICPPFCKLKVERYLCCQQIPIFFKTIRIFLNKQIAYAVHQMSFDFEQPILIKIKPCGYREIFLPCSEIGLPFSLETLAVFIVFIGVGNRIITSYFKKIRKAICGAQVIRFGFPRNFRGEKIYIIGIFTITISGGKRQFFCIYSADKTVAKFSRSSCHEARQE